MREPRLTCPHAAYRSGMRIWCSRSEDYCGNVYWKACKGWWALTANADRCPLRRGGDEHGDKGSQSNIDSIHNEG